MSVRLRVSWIKVDERPYIDALAFGVLLQDFVDQLRNEDDDDGAEAVLRVLHVVDAAGVPNGEVVA